MILDRIRGQDSALKQLGADMFSGRVGGAYLFSGPSGVGKRTTAIWFAKLLNCSAQKELRPCGVCSSCRRMARGNHPNLRLIEPDRGLFRIDQVRGIQRELSYQRFEGNWRVHVLIDADRLTQPAANALLKTLEEPPERTSVVVTTSNEVALLPTVISRCRVVRFNWLHPGVIVQILEMLTGGSSEEIAVASRLAQGSAGRGFALVMDKKMLGERSDIVTALESENGSLEAVFQMSQRWADRPDDVEIRLDILSWFLRDLLVLKSAAEISIVNTDLRGKLERVAERFSFSGLCRGISAIEEAHGQIRSGVSRRVVLEAMWLAIFFPDLSLPAFDYSTF